MNPYTNCLWCDYAFIPYRSTAIYCGASCRVASWRRNAYKWQDVDRAEDALVNGTIYENKKGVAVARVWLMDGRIIRLERILDGVRF